MRSLRLYLPALVLLVLALAVALGLSGEAPLMVGLWALVMAVVVHVKEAAGG